MTFTINYDNKIPSPPFWGVKCIDHVPAASIIPYVNRTALYKVQWGFKMGAMSREAYNELLKTEIEPIVTRLLKENNEKQVLKPQALYGYFACTVEAERLTVYDNPTNLNQLCAFDFPRQNGKRELCITDFFARDGEVDVVAFQLVTVGQYAADYARELFQKDEYKNYLYWHGLNVEVTEGLAEFIHKRIRAELGFSREDAREMKKLFKQEYRGSRYSFGYPACPRLEDQTMLLEILGAERINVTMSDEYQLWPEESTSAIVVHHPQAKYFVI